MKVSIIIPVYNAELYLEQCLNSILTQSFEDFEVIVINDGSLDKSAEILNQFAITDKRVKVFHQKNAGVSNARNTGLLNAKGEWITFIDSDDYITPNYFNYSMQSNADWVFVNISRDFNGEILDHVQFSDQQYNRSSFIDQFYLYPHFPGPWAKFFRREIICKNDLKFNPNLKFGEDAVFNVQYLNHCNIIDTTTSATYIYRDTENGLSQLNFDIKNDRVLYYEIRKGLTDYEGTEFYKKSLHFPLSRIIRVLFFDKSLTASQRRHDLKLLVDEHYKIVLDIYSDPKIRPLFYIAYKTGSYHFLNYALTKLHK